MLEHFHKCERLAGESSLRTLAAAYSTELSHTYGAIMTLVSSSHTTTVSTDTPAS